MPAPLEGQRTIVLGSTTGIGRATVLALAEAGANVIVHGKNSRGAAQDVAAEVRRMGRDSSSMLADLADSDQADRMLDAAWNLWGGLDAWVHFAGADVLTGENAKLSYEAKLDLLWKVDVLPTIRLTREVGRRMKAKGSGVIVNMGWDQAETGMEGDSGEMFAAIKGAVTSFSRSLALSLAPKVRVNVVAPGWIKTAWGEGAPSEWQQRVLRETPLLRWGRPEDVARATRFLVGPDSGFLTGQVIRVNGGAVRG